MQRTSTVEVSELSLVTGKRGDPIGEDGLDLSENVVRVESTKGEATIQGQMTNDANRKNILTLSTLCISLSATTRVARGSHDNG